MTILDQQGRPIEEHIRELLKHVVDELRTYASKEVQQSTKETIKRHVETIYPGSKHYSPEHVYDGPNYSVIVDIPGITRAYHDLNIKPVSAKKLAIPLHREAMGLPNSPKEIPDLFYAKNEKGTEMLARNEGGSLVVMYILKDRVHQKQDPRLMPSDDTIVDNIKARLHKLLDRAVKTHQ